MDARGINDCTQTSVQDIDEEKILMTEGFEPSLFRTSSYVVVPETSAITTRPSPEVEVNNVPRKIITEIHIHHGLENINNASLFVFIYPKLYFAFFSRAVLPV